MNRPGTQALLLVLIPLLLLAGCKQDRSARQARLDPRLPGAVAHALSGPSPMVGSRPLASPAALAALYGPRANRPGWLDGACPTRRAADLRRTLMAAGDQGLRPADYAVAEIGRLLDEARLDGCKEGDWPAARAAALELLLSDGLLLMAHHLAHGRLHQEDLSPRRRVEKSSAAVAALARVLSGEKVLEALGHLSPRTAAYSTLVATNRILREAAASGGWPTIPEQGDALRPGASGERVLALRRRLKAAGYPVSTGRDTYDRAVEVAVEAFQERAGLAPTGTVDARTLARLNSPVDAHLDRIALNLERWRWLPRDLGELAVLVNIPGQRVRLFTSGSEAMVMKAVVGRPSRPTPLLRSAINEIVVNPTWHVPESILSRDLLPKEDRSPGYLARRGFRWVEGGDAWGGYGGGGRLVQLPGRNNALGRIKLKFPNEEDVYLHDTSSPELFDKPNRFLSSGCVRLERAEALAAQLLRRSNGWPGDRVEQALAGGAHKRLALDRPVPVHLTYFTVWSTRPGALQVFEDVYELNGELEAALK